MTRAHRTDAHRTDAHRTDAHRAGALSAGFADPVADAQACFRAVLTAMARPGSLHALPPLAAAPTPLCSAAASVLLTLADGETPLWLDEAAAAARPWIAFHTGAPPADLSSASVALALALPPLHALSAGTDEAPEASATVILQLASLTGGRRFLLAGPGLREPAALTLDGMPPDFAATWARNQAQYPRGVDLVLCAGSQVTALPRSVSIKEA